jgi:lysophospholipase L1-like esterase
MRTIIPRWTLHRWLSACAPALLACFLIVVSAVSATAADAAKGPKPTIPEEKDRPRHDGFLEVAKAGNVDLLFLGDSITDGWRGGGRSVWEKYWAPLKAANFGIGGDRTEHVIWRLRHGELEGIQPKLVVLMIGTNNGDAAEDVALGIKTIIADINERSPASRILLLGIFPRGPKPAGRERNERVNTIISGYADNRKVVYMDIGQAFLTADGTLAADIMPDFLHPNEKGYQIWADAIQDQVKQMLQEDPTRLVPRITKPSAVAKVAKFEELIVSGKIGIGTKGLEKLVDDKNAKTAEAATASLAVVTEWKKGIDAEIARLKTEGDVYAAAELAAGMAAGYTGDQAKPYLEQAGEMKKDPAYAAGQAFQKLRQFPYVQRKDPRFAGLIEAFVKKYPEGYYTTLAKGLIPKE